MGRPTHPIAPSTAAAIAGCSADTTIQLRVEFLERRCAELWADEPRSSADRETALARLVDLEHRVGAVALRRVAEPDDHDLVSEVELCERVLDELAALWAAMRAA